MQYDQEKHILLCDQAHKRRIDSTSTEFNEYVEMVRNYPYDLRDSSKRMNLFEVEISAWPPIKRSPLQLLMGIGGETSDPFYKKPWVGIKWAVERNFWTQRATSEIARGIVPNVENFEQCRLAYQWQVEEFNPSKHVVIRSWCEGLSIDVAEFWIDFFPSVEGSVEIIKTTNPAVKDEMLGEGGYTPTRRCIFQSEKNLLRDNFFSFREKVGHSRPIVVKRVEKKPDKTIPKPTNLITTIQNNKVVLSWNTAEGINLKDIQGYQILLRNKSSDPPGEYRVFHETTDSFPSFTISDLAPETTYLFRVKTRLKDMRLSPWSNYVTVKSSKLKVDPLPEVVVEHEDDGENEEILPYEGAKIYTPSQVLHVLGIELGREFRLFGGATSDTKIVSMKKKALLSFLKEDTTDKAIYVADKGDRNFDCDNFSDHLRSSLQMKYGMNGVGIIWGDYHAWNFFVINGIMSPEGLDSGPRIIFVEPQDDSVVEELKGQFAINRRCEVYL